MTGLAPAPHIPRIVSAPEIQWDPLRPPTYDAATRRATVFNHADVLRVLRTDGATMTQQYGPTADREDEHPNRSFMWAWDGKAHDDRRKLLEEPFTRALRGIVPTIHARTHARIDEILRLGTRSFDLMSTLALVPYDIISALIGAPLEDTALFLEWLDEANSSTIDGMPRQDLMRDYFLKLIERAREDRGDGLLDHLLRAQADGVTLDGQPIRDRDILASLWGMYSAGTDTTGNSFASLLLMVVDDVPLLGALREEPELIGSIVEEALRLDPAFPLVTHETVQPVRFGDLAVPGGTKVAAWITSANRDPAVFDEPDVLKPLRRPNPHLTFGNGSHLCLGAPLARLELREMLRVLLTRLDELPNLRWDRDRPNERRPGIVHRFTSLHFAYD
jgi:cytochrome P450